jgi:hypothetical protein
MWIFVERMLIRETEARSERQRFFRTPGLAATALLQPRSLSPLSSSAVRPKPLGPVPAGALDRLTLGVLRRLYASALGFG